MRLGSGLAAALAAALAVVVALAACGSEQDPTLAVPSTSAPPSTSSSTEPTTPTSPVPPPDPGVCTGAEPASGDALTMNVEAGTLRSGAPARFVLTVTNGGDDAVELVFASGQDGDVTLTREGSEVYRWSEEMTFTQALRCQVLEPGATARYELPQPVLDVEPGEYQLRATLAAQPKPFDVATQVAVE